MSTPRYTYTTVNGVDVLTREEWHLNGEYHRIDGPANRQWEVVGGRTVLTVEEWYLDGIRHRTDGPAYQEWEVVNGQVFLTQDEWYLNGQLHRPNEPAYRAWDVVGGHGNEKTVLVYEVWQLNGQRHRIDGPAWRAWEVVDGSDWLSEEEWYMKGVKIHPRILRQPVRAIERWWLFQQRQRQEAIEVSLWDNGMTVFPGFMGLLREY